MKTKLLLLSAIVFTFLTGTLNAQAPVLGPAGSFALFTSNGAVSNTGLSQITGNVGTNNGLSTAFGNVNGVMHDQDGTTAASAASLLIAYNQLNAAIPTMFPAALLGNGETFTPGVYSIGQGATLNGNLTLDAQNNPNAIFIIKIQGSFSSNAASAVILANSAQACNVFWKVEGLVSLATGTSMKGNVIANNAAIVFASGVMLEGRALSTTGAVTVNGVTVKTPLGCTTPELTGPVAPPLASVACYTLFSGNGQVTNSGITTVTGDIGTNVGLTTGFNASTVTGTIHENPDTSTAQASLDLNAANGYLTTLQHDIELLYPAQFGNNLELTPHTYLLNAATVLTNTVTLNAQDNEDAVFVIKIVGALSTSTAAKVILINGAKKENVFWKVDGAVEIATNSEFTGTIICHNAAMNLATGTKLEGRALVTSGALSTTAVTATMPAGCLLGTDNVNKASASFYPNPFSGFITLTLPDGEQNNSLVIYNAMGKVVMSRTINEQNTRLEADFPTGIYFYRLTGSAGTVQSGKLIAN
jgi:hypothetical protein